MNDDEARFLRQLMATFRVEAEENLAAMSSLLGELRRAALAGDAARAVEPLFREAHSLKGAARAVNLPDVERVCQAMERLLSAVKHGGLAPSPPIADGLQRAVDGLGRLLMGHMTGAGGMDAELHLALVRELDALLAPGQQRPTLPATPAAVDVGGPEERAQPLAAVRNVAETGDTVRVGVARLDGLMAQAEELQAYRFGAAQLSERVRSLQSAMASWSRQVEASARDARALRRMRTGAAEGSSRQRRALMQLADAADRDERQAKDMLERLAHLEADAARHYRGLCPRLERLRADMRQLLMLPFAALFAPLPRLVRELAQAGGKEVELEIRGATLEVDRRILEQMKAPLNHLVRNAVDHGIEPARERLALGKRACARLCITVVPREGNLVELSVSDDGAGIDLAGVGERAVGLGLLDAAKAADASPEALADLVFASGLSTRATLTELSGHGLGLAIVREKVQALGGQVTVHLSDPGQGAVFRIVLPATLTAMRGLLVRAGGRRFVLPSRHVERVARIRRDAVRPGDQGGSVVLQGVEMPLVSLARVLQLAEPAHETAGAGQEHLQLVVVFGGEERVAFRVDEVEGDEELLLKPFAPPLRRVRHVAGATVLGAGEVVPLLHVADLMASAMHRHGPQLHGVTPVGSVPRASVLLADDSVTVRQRLQHVLEGEGYRVSTASDGLDAFARLQSGRFDLLVSDVEMPRLDGFGLTARVRSDPRLAQMPVVLVTGLESPQDHERGVEAGANAYITKSSFEQRRLLEAIRALV